MLANQGAIVALDWVEGRRFHTLVATAVMRGRAVHLLGASYPEWHLAKSQNNLPEQPGGRTAPLAADADSPADFSIGQPMLGQLEVPWPKTLAGLVEQLLLAETNWGIREIDC